MKVASAIIRQLGCITVSAGFSPCVKVTPIIYAVNGALGSDLWPIRHAIVARMQYAEALVYDVDGNFRGHAILKGDTGRLQSINLWTDNELPAFQSTLKKLNGSSAINDYWPKLEDPEVRALLDDPSWKPLEMELVDVEDEENSHYVFIKNTEGEDIIDRDASVVATKRAWIPKRPSDAQIRIHDALETVARRRAGIDG